MSLDRPSVHQAVAQLYNTYPFPPEPLLDEPPPGYNWRWHWTAAYSFCTGRKPERENVRILDAGCGTGVGTEYLVHLNPQAEVMAIDISEGALNVARERCRRSGATRVQFALMNVEDAWEKLPGEFDLINSVGVLHHLPDPVKGIQSLAKKLAPGGLFHIFVYGELGRWEIQLMQEAIATLQQNHRGDYTDGVKIGREIFATLPENNPLVQREKERWSLENTRDECFADMYIHPHEIDYNIHRLFELIDASGLQFVGFSNPKFWQIERLLGNSATLMERVQNLGERDRYRLIELLDPKSVTHYELFLTRPPLTQHTWEQDEDFLNAIPTLHPCLEGWESPCLLNCDYEIINLSEGELTFLKACADNGQKNVKAILETSDLDLAGARNLFERYLIVLAPNPS